MADRRERTHGSAEACGWNRPANSTDGPHLCKPSAHDTETLAEVLHSERTKSNSLNVDCWACEVVSSPTIARLVATGIDAVVILDAIKAVREQAAEERVAMDARGEPLTDCSSGVLDGIDNAMLAAKKAAHHPEDRREVTSIEEWWACEDAYQAGIDHAARIVQARAGEAACPVHSDEPMAKAVATNRRLLGQAAQPCTCAGEGALREAAAWVAEGTGYPVDFTFPDHPMPQALWDALVDHVHADETGRWHGNTLDRDDTESWLADEAGRAALATADPS